MADIEIVEMISPLSLRKMINSLNVTFRMILWCDIQVTVSLGTLKLEAKSELVAEITITKYKKQT